MGGQAVMMPRGRQGQCLGKICSFWMLCSYVYVCVCVCARARVISAGRLLLDDLARLLQALRDGVRAGGAMRTWVVAGPA